MKIARFLFLTACVSLGARALDAQQILFPKDAPVFSLIVPAGWRAEFQKDNVTLMPDPQDNYLIQINAQLYSPAESLPHIADAIATQLKMTGLIHFAPQTGANRHGVSCTTMTSRGKLNGAEMVITLVAFSLPAEKFFTAQGVATAETDQKHAREMRSIIDSIAPIARH